MDITDPFAMVRAIVAGTPWQFAAFVTALCFYHLSEYTITWAFNREMLSRDSWLLSKQYVVAMSAGCAEYALELALFPGFKRADAGYAWWIARIGLGMVVFGDATRKLAEITARHNFTHQIQYSKRQTHRVVSHGIYAWCRHPGYLGWLVWSVGTQVMLMNPVCTLVFAYWSWKFFAMRIPFEEGLLRRMFPGEYEAYAARTPTWIPGIP
jgi:protein-S-isoprenylcysteine O-methyltransferase